MEQIELEVSWLCEGGSGLRGVNGFEVSQKTGGTGNMTCLFSIEGRRLQRA